MEGFFQVSGAVMIAVIHCLTLSGENKSFSVVLSMVVCAIVLIMGMRYLEPLSDFLHELEALGDLSGDMIGILLKTALIGMITEIAALLCADGGNQTLAQALRILGAGVILWLSLPLFRGLLELVQRILEGI